MDGQLLFLVLLIGFTVWVFTRGRRQQRAVQLTQSRVSAGAEVMMTSGLYGTVTEVADDGTIRLETSPGQVSKWDRRAVARILTEPAVPEAPTDSSEQPPMGESVEPPAQSPVEPTVEPSVQRPADPHDRA